MLAALLISTSLLAVLPAATVQAECVGTRHRWPSFTEHASEARRIVVGTVNEDLHGIQPTGWFRLQVAEVLRGHAPEQLEIQRLKVRRHLGSLCGGIVEARVGDVIAIAWLPHGRATVAWIEGRPNRSTMRDAERLRLPEVRRSAGHAADGSTLPPDRGIRPSGLHASGVDDRALAEEIISILRELRAAILAWLASDR